jgi:hypothetical protein
MSGTPRSLGLFSAAALAAVLIAACSNTGTSTTAPSVAASAPASVAAPSVEASAPPSAEASPSAAASPAASAEAGSPAARMIEMYALDGSYQNPPIDPTPGTIITFRNLGTQAHELRLIRRNDDATDTQTFEDLSKVKAADLLKFATVVAVLDAAPNAVSDGSFTIDQPGDYAVVDFLATGTAEVPASPDPAMAPEKDSNYSKGMFTTFTAIEPAS